MSTSKSLCPCKDRPAAGCPGEWEPGCDLGNNPKHARMAPDELVGKIKALMSRSLMSNKAVGEASKALDLLADMVVVFGTFIRPDGTTIVDDLLCAERYRWLRVNAYIELDHNAPRCDLWNPDEFDMEIDKRILEVK